MSEVLSFREASHADVPHVLALYAQPGMNNGNVLDLESARDIFANFPRYPSYRLFVACDPQSKIVGSYAPLIMHNLAHQGMPAAVVEDVVVDQSIRGRGIGKKMMQHAVDLAREAGCYKLALSSNTQRERAHAFYDSLGFARHGISFAITP